MLEYTVDLSRFHQLARETERLMGEGTRRAVHEAAIAGADYARNHHPHIRRTGKLTGANLFSRIVSTDQRSTYAELVNTTEYAVYVERGTRPHRIEPKRKGGTLRFMVGGRTVYAKSVQHPGTKPLPFMQPAADYAGQQIVFETEHVTFVLCAELWN